MKTLYPMFMLLALSTFHAFGQDYRIKKQFFIGIFASPDFSYNSPLDTKATNQSVDRDGKNKARFGYTGGIEALYQINEKFSVTLGLQYSSKGGKLNNVQYYPSLGPDPYKQDISYDYRFIDIPIRLDYYLNEHKVAPFITAGIATCILIGQQTTGKGIITGGDPFERTTTSTTGFSTVIPQLQIGAGIDVAFKKSRLRIFPLFRISPMQATFGSLDYYYTGYSAKNLKGRIYSIGLGINYFFRLTKH